MGIGMADNVQIDGLVEQQQALEALMMKNPAMEKKVQGLIRKVLMEVRRAMGNEARGAMKSDPRQAYKAVKTAVYRQILGGSVSILNKRRAGRRLPEPPVVHQLEHRVNSKGNHRGGNRMPRSQRTIDLLTYDGADRGFVLRFLNAGTSQRYNVGNRGSIAPRNWFGNRSQREMEHAADRLTQLIDELIQQEMK